MPNDFLSDDEVDALLKGVPVEDDAEVAEETKGVRPFDLASQQRPTPARLPGLDAINERFARLLRVGLFDFMRRSPEISVAPARFVRHDEFLRDLVAPANLNVVQVTPAGSQALVVLEPTLVFLIVDTLFGGDGRFRTRVEPREFTQTEQRIIARLLAVLFDAYHKAWQPTCPLGLEHVRSEMHAQFAQVASPGDLLVVATFSAEFGAGGGAVHIALPYATLEPLREVLGAGPAGKAATDPRWARTLSQQVQAAEVTLVAALAHASVTVRELLAMQVGDVLGVEIAPTIEASVDGLPILDCTYGVRNGQYALRIERVRAPERDTAPGGSHV